MAPVKFWFPNPAKRDPEVSAGRKCVVCGEPARQTFRGWLIYRVPGDFSELHFCDAHARQALAYARRKAPLR